MYQLFLSAHIHIVQINGIGAENEVVKGGYGNIIEHLRVCI
jgi:hypothetical protein